MSTAWSLIVLAECPSGNARHDKWTGRPRLLDILFDGQKVAGWNVARYESVLSRGNESRARLPSTEPDFTRLCMKALLLDHPELGPTLLEESCVKTARLGRVELSEVLDRPALAHFADTEGTSCVLAWTVNGDIGRNAPQLPSGRIAEKDRESRLRAFSIMRRCHGTRP